MFLSSTGFFVSLLTYKTTKKEPIIEAMLVAITIPILSIRENNNKSAVVPTDMQDAITANIIDTKNFRSLLTGAVPTAVTTNILYLISMKTLLTIILITPYSSKFDNASLTMKLYAR